MTPEIAGVLIVAGLLALLAVPFLGMWRDDRMYRRQRHRERLRELERWYDREYGDAPLEGVPITTHGRISGLTS